MYVCVYVYTGLHNIITHTHTHTHTDTHTHTYPNTLLIHSMTHTHTHTHTYEHTHAYTHTYTHTHTHTHTNSNTLRIHSIYLGPFIKYFGTLKFLCQEICARYSNIWHKFQISWHFKYLSTNILAQLKFMLIKKNGHKKIYHAHKKIYLGPFIKYLGTLKFMLIKQEQNMCMHTLSHTHSLSPSLSLFLSLSLTHTHTGKRRTATDTIVRGALHHQPGPLSHGRYLFFSLFCSW